jgi:hypothetical protein
METRKPEFLPPPPNAIQAITAGFNAIANRLESVLFPIGIDILFWLGPRLKLDLLLAPLLAEYRSLGSGGSESVFGDPQQTFEVLGSLNILGMLRSLPIGVSSLLAFDPAVKTPFGQRLDIQVDNWLIFLGMVILFPLIGWLAGCFYYYLLPAPRWTKTLCQGWLIQPCTESCSR